MASYFGVGGMQLGIKGCTLMVNFPFAKFLSKEKVLNQFFRHENFGHSRSSLRCPNNVLAEADDAAYDDDVVDDEDVPAAADVNDAAADFNDAAAAVDDAATAADDAAARTALYAQPSSWSPATVPRLHGCPEGLASLGGKCP